MPTWRGRYLDLFLVFIWISNGSNVPIPIDKQNAVCPIFRSCKHVCALRLLCSELLLLYHTSSSDLFDHISTLCIATIIILLSCLSFLISEAVCILHIAISLRSSTEKKTFFPTSALMLCAYDWKSLIIVTILYLQ